MIQTKSVEARLAEMMVENEGLQLALDRATKTALLEHARMGRSVYEGRDGKVVEVTPVEIFARYGLDEFGRPCPAI